MDLKTAAKILCEVHTTTFDDGLFMVDIGATPGYWMDYDRYHEAWLTLHALTKPASPEPPTTPAGELPPG